MVEGDFVQFSCNVTSEPPSVVSWYYPNGTIVDESSNYDKLSIIKLRDGSFLTIRELQSVDQE
jgi:hypothetical protein